MNISLFKNLDPNTQMWLLGGAVVAGFLILFIIVRALVEWQAKKLDQRLNGQDDSGVLLRRDQPPQPTNWADRLDLSFDNMVRGTGLEMTPPQALGWICLSGAGVAALLYFFREEWWMAAIGLAFGSLMLVAIFFMIRFRYKNQLQNQLPDALYLMARSLRAGMSLDQTIELVGQQGMPPLATEFQRCAQQIKLGLPTAIALENSANRVQLLDMNALVSIVSMHQTTGGNLPMLLDRLAAGARDRNQFRSYFRTNTALARISSVFIACAPPLFLLGYLILQPEYVETFMQSWTGWLVILGVFVLEILGLLWIYRLLQVEY